MEAGKTILSFIKNRRHRAALGSEAPPQHCRKIYPIDIFLQGVETYTLEIVGCKALGLHVPYLYITGFSATPGASPSLFPAQHKSFT
eukprot:1156111-Pelagomonas_calceolata.AAC.1